LNVLKYAQYHTMLVKHSFEEKMNLLIVYADDIVIIIQKKIVCRHLLLLSLKLRNLDA